MTSRSAIAGYERTYPQKSRAVAIARRDVVEYARTYGFAGQSLDDVEVAVGEGLANAVEHSCGLGAGIHVTVRVAVRQDAATLTIEIKDSGRGFDHGRVCSRQNPPSESLRGFGTFIMRELMDEVHYSENGTRLSLVKQLPAVADRRDERSG